MGIIEGNQKAVVFGLSVLAAGGLAYAANESVHALGDRLGLSSRVDAFFQKGIKTNSVGALWWVGSCIAAPFKWTWSCIRHPISTVMNIPHRIYQVASFIWGWTGALAFRAASYALHNYFPSLKIPLFVGLVGGGITFVTHQIHSDYRDDVALIKFVAIPILTAVASYQLAHRYTNLTPSKLEAGAWSLLPSLSLLILNTISEAD